MRASLLRIALFAAVALAPAAVLAAVPPNITGIAAELSNGQVTVQWDAPQMGDVISAYRVYFGQKSILGNNGAYDDFVTTSGKNTSLVFTDLPPYAQMFLTVAAVNDRGEESAAFVEEVQLDLTKDEQQGQTSSSSAVSVPPASPAGPQPPKGTPLPKSGPEMLGLVLAGGAGAGWRKMRRNRS